MAETITSNAFAMALDAYGSGCLEDARGHVLRVLAQDPRHVDSLHLLGMIEYQANHLDVATKMLRRALAVNGRIALIHSNLGIILQCSGQVDEALESYRRALEMDPNLAGVFNNLGSALLQKGLVDDAMKAFERAIAIDPEFVQALQNLANTWRDSGEFDRAEALYTRALALPAPTDDLAFDYAFMLRSAHRTGDAISWYERGLKRTPNHAAALNNLGELYIESGNSDLAVTCYERAIQLDPNSAAPLNNLGNALRYRRDFERALACFQRAAEVAVGAPTEQATVLSNLGTVLRELRQYEEAHHTFQRALKADPNSASAYANLGALQWDERRLSDARCSLEHALFLEPDLVEAHCTLGSVLLAEGKVLDAATHIERALALKPNHVETNLNRAILQLLQGEYQSGWRNFECRLHCHKDVPQGYSKKLWRGEPLEGASILLHAEQGLGDTLQFLRFVPEVVAAGGHVILDVQPMLRRLVSAQAWTGIQIASADSELAFEWECPLMGLPLALDTKVEAIPQPLPLAIPNEAESRAQALLWPVAGLRVGIVWAGNPKHENDKLRSLNLSQLAPLFEVPDVYFFSLQMGASAEQREEFKASIVDLTAGITDMADTAARIAQLDLVIAADTAVAHLAATLGKPTWIMIPAGPDWRWMLDREDSPWYPSVRLFRQPAAGAWDEVIKRVCADLSAVACGDRSLLQPRG